MTNHAHGSSLLQARSEHLHHRHSLVHKSSGAAGLDAADEDAAAAPPPHGHVHVHALVHQHQQQPQQPPRTHALSHEELHHHHQVQRRQLDDADLDAYVTHVIQTVSVVQYVDGAGVPLGVSTVYSPPRTALVDDLTGITVDPSFVETRLPTAASLPGGGSDELPSPSDDAATPSSPSLTVTTDPFSLSSSSLSVTSAPLPSSSSFPTLPGAVNTTASQSSLFSNSTIGSFLNSTASSSSLSSTSSESVTSTSSTNTWSSHTLTDAGSRSTFGPLGGPGVGNLPGATTPPEATGGASSSNTPKTETLVGGVVGGVCGLALIVFAAFFVLRWRRQRANGHKLSGGGESDWGVTPVLRAGLVASPTPGQGGAPGSARSRGFSNRMSERGLPFAIPSSLAALSGAKKPGDEGTVATRGSPGGASGGGGGSSGGGERGFVRVSGRKLPSVLQHGGDGYSSPSHFDAASLQALGGLPPPGSQHGRNDSTLSGTSFYRDSHGFYGGTGAAGEAISMSAPTPPPRLAVGSPMRPDSGIPVIQPGPARTPVTEQSPVFESMPPTLTPPLMPRRDPLGRSHPSQDGSRASGSRFTEDIR